VSQDIGSALDALQATQPQIQRFVLWGLCDGASAILLYLNDRADPRVAAVILVNPWVRSAQSLARTHMKHYYLQRLIQKDFWVKLAHGGIGLSALTDAIRSTTAAIGRSRARSISKDRPVLLPRRDPATFQARMAQGLRGFGGKTLLLLSENDYTAKEFIEFTSQSAAWKPLLAAASLSRVQLPNTDHTFSGGDQARRALDCSVEWMNRALFPDVAAAEVEKSC
jgi:exosortase A-associated hydrolase 1